MNKKRNIGRAIVGIIWENDLTEETKMETEKKNYVSGIFDRYKVEKNLDLWDGFPELMWAMGYEMDCENSFNEYRGKSNLKLNEAHSEREEKRNILYLLEHADRQIVGNYLFSHWRYYTHWAYGYNGYDIDFLCRIIDILEKKYKVENKQ